MRLSTDRIVSLSAMAVGVSSLFIILYQTHLMRQEQRASALPYLMFAIDANEAGIHLTLTNAGLGPALIEDVRVVHSDREFEGDPHDYFTVRSIQPRIALSRLTRSCSADFCRRGRHCGCLDLMQRGRRELEGDSSSRSYCIISKWQKYLDPGMRTSARRTCRRLLSI